MSFRYWPETVGQLLDLLKDIPRDAKFMVEIVESMSGDDISLFPYAGLIGSVENSEKFSTWRGDKPVYNYDYADRFTLHVQREESGLKRVEPAWFKWRKQPEETKSKCEHDIVASIASFSYPYCAKCGGVIRTLDETGAK